MEGRAGGRVRWSGRIAKSSNRKEQEVRVKRGARTMALVHVRIRWLRDERGAAETSTILAWIVVGVLVVFALRAGLTNAGNDVITWVQHQITNVTAAPANP